MRQTFASGYYESDQLYGLFTNGTVKPGMIIESRSNEVGGSFWLVLDGWAQFADDDTLTWHHVACIYTGKIIHFSKIPKGKIVIHD